MTNVSCYCDLPIHRFYRYLMAFIFAIDEINKNPDILPNTTLGYHVYDPCNNVNNAIDSVLQILSGPGHTAPNYFCAKFGHLVGVIGDINPDISLNLAQILSLYGYTQISYGAVDPILSTLRLFPSFFQALPNFSTQCLAIVHLLRHYNWTWIGVITSDDDVGEKQSQELKAMAAQYDICVEFSITINDGKERKTNFPETSKILSNSTSQVVVICGKFSFFVSVFIHLEIIKANEKTYIVPAGWIAFNTIVPGIKKPALHGSLVFSPPTKKMPNLRRFLQDISLINRPHDVILENILAYTFHCLTSDPIKNNRLRSHSVHLHECNRTIKLGELSNNLYNTERFGITYLVYKSVYAMAHSLHEMQIQMSGNSKEKYKEIQLKKYLRRVRFTDPYGEDVRFNEKGEMSTIYHILNYASPTRTALVFSSVGHFNVSSQEGNQLKFYNVTIHWKHSLIPVSTCSEQCPPGYKRAILPGIHKCCFVCLECSEGEMSNKTDSVSCHKCPEDQWPNDMNQCVPKPIELLSYKNDSTVLTVSIISIICFLKTSIILGIFILFRDTPVVRANNQTLSFILLASIMLSFLCVFLFLGRPTHVSCMLRQTSFGIIFSVAISSILAKTILVYTAFKATKPGSSWRKFIGVKIPNCVVFFCSLLQVLLSIIWLSTSPPFPEMNTHLYQDKIIFQCNEGSMLAFSILLGYMGLLAAVSFMVAFLARNLPDSFNEAKNITFSMLVVCSVWVAFIPAYMSVTGKNTVLVEIFAIISSSVGILGCIFFPKCYIILVRPELNSKCSLSRQMKTYSLHY
ncbi:vomeronasal type-2 receptor 26-like [Leptodactylus fuscus]